MRGWQRARPRTRPAASAPRRAGRRGVEQRTADRKGRPRWSGSVRSPVDRGTARTRHLDTVALDAAVKLAAVLVLVEEGGEGREQQSRPGEEIRVARRPEPTAARQPFRVT